MIFDVLSEDESRAIDVALVTRHFADGSARPRPAWLRDADRVWIDIEGVRWEKRDTDRIHERRTVRSGAWEELPWEHTDLVCPEHHSGWLGPDGTWTGCAAVWHDVVVRFVFRSTVSAIERTHVRVSAGYVRAPTLGVCTPAQAAWLRARGLEVPRDPSGEEEARAAREEVARQVKRSGRPLARRRDGD